MSETSPTTLPAATDGTATPTPSPHPSPTATSTTTPSALTPETPPAKAEDGSVLSQKPEDKKPEAKLEGPPEKYEFKAPEGYELDTEVTEEASALFKEIGLSQAEATRLVDLYTMQMQKHSQSSLQTVKDMRAGWVTEAKALPKIGDQLGPDGAVPRQLGRALDSLVSTQAITAKTASDFRQALGLTGAGDHPAIIQVIHALTTHFAEGSPVRGNSPSPHGQTAPGAARKSAAQEIYPTLGTGT